MQQEKRDSLTEGYESELWDFTHTSVTQNDLQELKEIWDSWNDEINQHFYYNYGGLPYLLDVKIQADRAYSRPINIPPFLKKFMNITGMSEQWVAARIKQKEDNMKKRVDIFTLSLYGLIVFPEALGHVEEAVSDLFDGLDKRTTPVLAILAETFRSLNARRRMGEERFVGYTQLLVAWFHSHFWKVEKVFYQILSKDYSPLRELMATPRRDDISKEKWIAILQSLQGEDVEWRAPWLIPDKILYRCGDLDWVPLAGI
ncbi:hypothetical protein PVK06_040789 [Gossypium arboreum]|uniref:DUF7745 domain-containing protein n=1 Tax=Gossypium arboreum TaxID=29729 RepID=A0ABR0N6D8_GOSAR|nr:hypothetical protein PVK06_040789 [Gossypium arboreum]